MHSSLPEQLTNFNFSKSKLLKGIFKKLEDTSLLASDAIITICPALADYVNKIIDKPEKHLLIENSIFDTVQLKQNSNQQIQEYDPVRVKSELPKNKIDPGLREDGSYKSFIKA